MINAFKYTETLEEAGFSENEAKATIKIWLDIMDSNFATKNDVERLETKLSSEIKGLRSEMKEMELRLTIKLGSLMALGLTLTAIIQKL